MRRKPDFIQRFIGDITAMEGLHKIDYVVLNAGILRYPNVSAMLYK